MAGLTEPNQSLRREDIANMLINVESENFPLFSMIPKGAPLKATLHEIPHDSYGNVSIGGIPDGKDVGTFKDRTSRRKKLPTRYQWFREPWSVGKIAQNISDVAGVSDEVAYHKMVALYELKRNIEVQLGSDIDSQDDDGIEGSRTRGLGEWIKATAQTNDPVPTEYLSNSAQIDTTAIASVTDAVVNGVLDQLYDNRKKRSRYLGVCGSTFKGAITALAQYETGVSSTVAAIRTFNQEASSKKILATVDFYEGDTGEIEFSLSPWLGYQSDGTAANGARRCYVLDMDKVEIAPNQQPEHHDLEDSGGGPRGYWDAIYTLKCLSPLCHGKFAATS